MPSPNMEKKRDRSTRKDLHYKMILREFRQFFLEKLRKDHNYVARKGKKPRTYFQTCLKRVLRDLGF